VAQKQFDLYPEEVRKFTDPGYPDAYLYEFLVAGRNLPEGLQEDPNPRRFGAKRANKPVVKDVRKAARGEEGTPAIFHLKALGIWHSAQDVEKLQDAKPEAWRVFFRESTNGEDGDGIVNGSGLYHVLRDEGEAVHEDVKVFFRVPVGYPDELLPEIAEAQNAGLQVEEVSRVNQAGLFQPIKTAIKGMPFQSDVAYREGDPGSVSVLDVVANLVAFDVEGWPNDSFEHPVITYNSRVRTLDYFEDHGDRFVAQGYLDLLPDILALHDLIQADAKNHWSSPQFGKLDFVDAKSTTLPYTRKTTTHVMKRGAIMPMLAAFRSCVEKKNGSVRWIEGGDFEAVKQVWKDAAPRLLKRTQKANERLAYNVTALGKNVDHWDALHAQVSAFAN
jgi:hypothetical protein